MMVPNHVENWIMLIETNKIGISSLPLKVTMQYTHIVTRESY